MHTAATTSHMELRGSPRLMAMPERTIAPVIPNPC